MPYVYILRCIDQTYYTGYTTDLTRRVDQHNQGIASRYTRGRRPVELVYSEELSTKSLALKREIEIKKLKRPQKEKLIASYT
ncbi:MAG: GIY-YIG nuclease family protein [Syntrophomonadaceae bacterium]|nr:GIY-YIG nuclease family protein [Syntrophomonadaceae bacterium]